MMLLGGPGSGKGTQGRRLARHFGVPHLASGDLLRDQVRAGSEVGRQVAGCLDAGRLVPDDLVFDLMLPAVLSAAEAGGYILDGFPRSVAQAVRADAELTRSGAGLECVLFLAVPEEELVGRLLERADSAGRSDDTAEVIADRLRVFQAETRPLVEHYRAQRLLVEVPADQSADRVTEAILAAVESHGMPQPPLH
jgi:adenylate kinase